jgi:hypothetical protein
MNGILADSAGLMVRRKRYSGWSAVPGVIKGEGQVPVPGNAMNRPVESIKPSITGNRRMAKPTGRINPFASCWSRPRCSRVMG